MACRCKLPRELWCDFLEGCAAAFEGHHLSGEIRDAIRGILRADSARVNVGDEISVGVGLARAGSVGHVGGKAFGGGEARALSDQQNDHAGREKIANVVYDADARVTHDERLPDGPTETLHLLLEKWEEERHLGGDRGGREAVADHDLDVRRFGAALNDQVLCGIAEGTTKIRAQQKLGFRFGSAANMKEAPLRDELGRQVFLQIKLCPDRVHGAGVRGAKFEGHLRGISEAALDKDARGRTGPDFPDNLRPRGRRGKFVGVVHGSNQETATKKSFLSATSAKAASIRIENPAHCSIVKAPNVWPRKRR